MGSHVFACVCVCVCVCAEIAQVTTAYSASGTEQLSVAPGQLILILSKNASGWWLGELQVRMLLHPYTN